MSQKVTFAECTMSLLPSTVCAGCGGGQGELRGRKEGGCLGPDPWLYTPMVTPESTAKSQRNCYLHWGLLYRGNSQRKLELSSCASLQAERAYSQSSAKFWLS